MHKSANNIKKLCNLISKHQDYQEFVNYLKLISKNESINDLKRHRAILNTNQKVIGISMKDIRNVAKEISYNCLDEFLEIAKNKKIESSYYEETLIEGLVIAEIKYLDLQILKLKEWVTKIDNWSTCDSVVTSLKLLKKSINKDYYFDEFLVMSKSSNEFVARFGIVVMMSVYLDLKHIDAIYKNLLEIKSEKYYINMAIAWLFSYGF